MHIFKHIKNWLTEFTYNADIVSLNWRLKPYIVTSHICIEVTKDQPPMMSMYVVESNNTIVTLDDIIKKTNPYEVILERIKTLKEKNKKSK